VHCRALLFIYKKRIPKDPLHDNNLFINQYLEQSKQLELFEQQQDLGESCGHYVRALPQGRDQHGSEHQPK